MRNIRKNRKKRIEQDKEQHTNKGESVQINPDMANHNRTEQPVKDTQTLYRALFENANDAIFIADDEKFIECNSKTLEIFGCSSEQIIGKTPYDPYSPQFQPDGRESKEKAHEKINLVMQGQPQFFEWRHLRYDGSAFDAEVSLNRLKLSGKILIQAVVRDITERKQLEDKLKKGEEKYQTIVEHVNEIIYMLDPNHILTYISPQCEKISGYTAQELIGQQWDSFATDNPINKLARDIFEEAKETGKPPEPHQVEIRGKDGDVIVLEVNDRILRDAKGDITGVVGSARDITERKKLEDKLKTSEEKYKTLVEHVNEIIFMHDSNILTYISPQCEKITGYTDQELVGQRWDSFATDNPMNKLALDKFEEARETGKPLETHQVEIIKKNGDVIVLEVNDRILRNSNGDITGVVGSARDITSQKLTEQALAESEKKFRTFFENEPEYCYMISPQGKILEANSAALNVFGYAKEELIGKPIDSLYAPELSERVGQLLSQWKQTGEIRNEEMVIITRNGDRRIVLLSSTQVLDENGKPLHSISIQRDITERKKVQEELMRSEETARAFLKATTDLGMLIDREGLIIDLNDRMAKSIGRTRNEMIGNIIYDYLPSELAEQRKAKGLEIAKKRKLQRFEDHRDNRWFENSVYPIFDTKGEVGRFAVFSRDITERKRAEDSIRESEEKFRSLAEYSPNMIFINKAGRIVYANKACEEITGYKREELCSVDFDFLTLIASESLDLIKENYRKHVKGREISPYQYTIINKAGERIDAINSSKLIHYEGQMAILGVVTDITEQKRAEKALAASELKYRSLFDNSIEGIGISSGNQIISANKALLDIYGYDSVEEFTRIPILDLVAPESKEMVQGLMEKAEKGGVLPTTYEHRIICKNGQLKDVEVSTVQISKDGNQYAQSAFRDITERKRMEEAYHSLVDNSLQGLAIVQDGRIAFLNKAFYSATDYSRKDFINATPEQFQSIVHPDDRELVWSRHRDRLAGKPVPPRYDCRWVRKDGGTCWLEIYASRIEYNGRPAIQVAYVDITERKKAEKALKESEEKYRSIIANIPDVVWTTNQNGQTTFISSNIEKIYGYTPEEICEEGDKLWFGRIHPDDVERVKKAFEAVFEGEVQLDVEYRIRRKDGEWMWVHDRSIGAYEKNGIKHADGVFSDITERKKAQEALFKEKKFTEDTINAQIDTFFVFETGTGKAIRWNKAFTDISGYTDGEIARMPAPASYYSPEDLERAAAFIQKVLKEGIGTIELELICKDGRKVPTEYRVSIINDDQGEPKYFISIGRDITERKRAEEAMKKSSIIIDSTADAVITTDIAGNITFWNKGAEIIYGYQKEKAIGKPVSILYKDENLHVLETMIADLMEGKDTPGIEATCIDMNQQDVEILLTLTSVRDADGNITELVGITKDITERKRMEERVAKSRELFSRVFYANPISATITTVSNDKLLMVNDAWLKLIGFDSQEEAIGKSAVDLGLWADVEDREERNINLQQEGSSGIQEMRVHTPSGRIRDCLYTAEMIEYESQPHILSMAIDITDRKKAQQKLLEYQSQLKSLASELLLAEERERRRIATGVHDDIGQKLALAKLELQSMQAIVTEPDVSKSLGHACELIDKGIQDARSLAFDLSNPVLYEVGFVAAVESLLTEQMIRKSGIKSEFKSKTRKLKLGQDMSIVLFQAVRELLTNVVKHANANKVKVCIDKSEHKVQVIVEDDGVGFELSKLQSPDRKKGGFGLFNVKERLEYLGGSFDIKSKPRQGTRVMMAVPLESGIMVS